jgi:NarL family two-component system sensor histidine kinase YdfH
MLVFGFLLWVGLVGRAPRRYQWLYFLLLGFLAVAIGGVLRQESVVLSLFLALTLGAVAILTRARDMALVIGGASALFLVSLYLDQGPWVWQHWLGFLAVTDYAAVILFVLGFIVLYVQQMRAHTQLEAAHAGLETTHRQLRASAERIEALTLIAERQRLARELHDTLAQGVAGLVMRLEAATAELGQRRLERVEDILRESMASARLTLADAREAIEELRTVASCDEFAARLREEVRRFEAATDIPCEMDLASLELVPAGAYEAALHTVREGLLNVGRHARATAAWVRVAVDAEDPRAEDPRAEDPRAEDPRAEARIAVEVRDNGVGWESPPTGDTVGHYGLVGLRERARLAGGALEVRRALPAGTIVRLRLPFALEGASA